MPETVEWLGLQAVYTEDERPIMAALPVNEQTILHVLKAFTEGTLGGESRLSSVPTPAPENAEDCPVYVDPEDIPFGEDSPPAPRISRKDQLIVLQWTNGKARAVKTKKRGNELMKVWRKWKERHGWTVKNLSGSESMIATSCSGSREAITLRVYEKKRDALS